MVKAIRGRIRKPKIVDHRNIHDKPKDSNGPRVEVSIHGSDAMRAFVTSPEHAQRIAEAVRKHLKATNRGTLWPGKCTYPLFDGRVSSGGEFAIPTEVTASGCESELCDCGSCPPARSAADLLRDQANILSRYAAHLETLQPRFAGDQPRERATLAREMASIFFRAACLE